MKAKEIDSQWNLIRERLGLCPIEEVVKGQSQVGNRLPEDRQEMTLERFKEKWGKK